MRILAALTAVTTTAGIAMLPAISQANGRYPAAQYFSLGENGARDRIAIVTTFGLVVSTDGGRSWGWICEDALGYQGQFDSVTGITDDGTLVATLPDGVARATGDWCNFERPPSSAGAQSVDLTVVGNRVAAAMTPIADPQFLQLSNNAGQSFTRGWSRNDFYMQTLDFAPSRTSRMYLTAWVRGAVPALFRSDDMGLNFAEITRDFSGGYIAYISWVDPLNEQTLLVRSDLDPSGALLLRSDDGAAGLRVILRSPSALVGVAAAPGAQTIWASNTALDGHIQRTMDGGMSWASVRSAIRPRSLRFARDILFATTGETETGFSFSCSRDGGDTFVPMLALADIRGPERCPAGSNVRTMCAGGWDALRARLAMVAHPVTPPRGVCEGPPVDLDAGVPVDGSISDDARVADGQVPSDVASGRDVAEMSGDSGLSADGGLMVGGGGRCGCTMIGHKSKQNCNFAVTVLLVLSTGRITRKRLRK